VNSLRDRRIGAILGCLLIILLTALAGCGGGDVSAEEVEQHDQQQTIHPVSCAASGCAR